MESSKQQKTANHSPFSALLSSIPELFSEFLAASPSPPLNLVTEATAQQPEATVQLAGEAAQQAGEAAQQAGGGPRDRAAKKRKQSTTRSSQAERRRLLDSVPDKAPRPTRGGCVCGTPRVRGWCSKPLGHLGNCDR